MLLTFYALSLPILAKDDDLLALKFKLSTSEEKILEYLEMNSLILVKKNEDGVYICRSIYKPIDLDDVKKEVKSRFQNAEKTKSANTSDIHEILEYSRKYMGTTPTDEGNGNLSLQLYLLACSGVLGGAAALVWTRLLI